MTLIKEYLWGKKKPTRHSPINDLTPKGVTHTIVPKEFQGKQAPKWDEDLFKNKIYIQ